MSGTWTFFGKPKNRQIFGWIGSGLVVAASGAWAVFTYVLPPHDPAKPGCVQQGIAINGNVSGSPVTNTVNGSTVSGPCETAGAGK